MVMGWEVTLFLLLLPGYLPRLPLLLLVLLVYVAAVVPAVAFTCCCC